MPPLFPLPFALDAEFLVDRRNSATSGNRSHAARWGANGHHMLVPSKPSSLVPSANLGYLVDLRTLQLPGLVPSYAPSNSASAFKLQLSKSDFSALTGPQLSIGSTFAAVPGLTSDSDYLRHAFGSSPSHPAPTLRHSWNELKPPVYLQRSLDAIQFESIRDSVCNLNGASLSSRYTPNGRLRILHRLSVPLLQDLARQRLQPQQSIPIVSVRPERSTLHPSLTLKVTWTPFNLTCIKIPNDALDALPSILARIIVKIDFMLEIDQRGSNELSSYFARLQVSAATLVQITLVTDNLRKPLDAGTMLTFITTYGAQLWLNLPRWIWAELDSSRFTDLMYINLHDLEYDSSDSHSTNPSTASDSSTFIQVRKFRLNCDSQNTETMPVCREALVCSPIRGIPIPNLWPFESSSYFKTGAYTSRFSTRGFLLQGPPSSSSTSITSDLIYLLFNLSFKFPHPPLASSSMDVLSMGNNDSFNLRIRLNAAFLQVQPNVNFRPEWPQSYMIILGFPVLVQPTDFLSIARSDSTRVNPDRTLSMPLLSGINPYPKPSDVRLPSICRHPFQVGPNSTRVKLKRNLTCTTSRRQLYSVHFPVQTSFQTPSWNSTRAKAKTSVPPRPNPTNSNAHVQSTQLPPNSKVSVNKGCVGGLFADEKRADNLAT
ncbi:hypothetical protein C8R46DRAFT_1031178 [Mycena filopes]|nr:hypothetical protein C8R46DRAFT_1031178 [Mycena filopes]